MKKNHSKFSELTKINTLFVDFKTLVKFLENSSNGQIDYRRIGVEYMGSRINLSRVMYKIVEVDYAIGQREAKIMVDENSYDIDRHFIIDQILMSIISIIESGMSKHYVKNIIKGQIEYVDWLHGQGLVLTKNVNLFKQSLAEYKRYLERMVKPGDSSKQKMNRLYYAAERIAKQQSIKSNHTVISTIFIDFEMLAKCMEENIDSDIDYRRIGVEYGGHKINLSHIMFDTFEIGNSGKESKVYLVDEGTYDDLRRDFVDGIVLSLYPMVELGFVKSHIINNCRYQIKYLNWLNEQNIRYPKNIQEAKQSFLAYRQHLEGLVKISKMALKYASVLHDATLKLLEYVFNDKTSEIASSGIIKNRKNRGNSFSREKSIKRELEYAFSFYYNFFNQVADFVLEGKSYPFSIQLPRGKALVMPSIGINIVPSYQERSKNVSMSVNCVSEQIISEEELEAMIIDVFDGNQIKLDISLKRSMKKLSERLLAVNSDLTCEIRRELGNKAMKSYYMVLLAITAMNDSTLGRMLWGEDDFTTTAERQEFRGIKARAKNKEVTFEIRKHFIGSFKKFLKLRRFVLNGHACDYLFFNLRHSKISVIKNQLSGRYAASIHRSTFVPIDIELPFIGASDYRKDAALDAMLLKGPKAAVVLLQNSIDVLGNHYDGQSTESKAHEIHNFLTSVNKSIVTKSRSPNEDSGLIGGCENKDKIGKPVDEECEVIPDCNDLKTCIFCEFFKTHPEKEEIRKLYSLEYIINEIALQRAISQEHYNGQMEPWLTRIDALLNEMKILDPMCIDIIDIVRAEVYNEQQLTPYWTYMLDIFEQLEVLR